MDNVLLNKDQLKNAKDFVCCKHSISVWLLPTWNIYLKNSIYNSYILLTSPAPEIKKLVLVGKIMWHEIGYMFYSFVASLDIAVMINILQQINRILQEKVLKAMILYEFHKNASQKNNSLNDHSGKSSINE